MRRPLHPHRSLGRPHIDKLPLKDDNGVIDLQIDFFRSLIKYPTTKMTINVVIKRVGEFSKTIEVFLLVKSHPIRAALLLSKGTKLSCDSSFAVMMVFTSIQEIG